MQKMMIGSTTQGLALLLSVMMAAPACTMLDENDRGGEAVERYRLSLTRADGTRLDFDLAPDESGTTLEGTVEVTRPDGTSSIGGFTATDNSAGNLVTREDGSRWLEVAGAEPLQLLDYQEDATGVSFTTVDGDGEEVQVRLEGGARYIGPGAVILGLAGICATVVIVAMSLCSYNGGSWSYTFSLTDVKAICTGNCNQPGGGGVN